MKFEVGDTVRLKSGGPLMTVEVINAGNIRCVWFKKGDVERGVFNHALLESDSILPDLTVDEDIDTFDKLVKIANSEHDGHLAILKFTTNWRVGFVTPEDREMISEMAVGDTFAEAATHALYPPKKD